jgi:hypothetical protein
MQPDFEKRMAQMGLGYTQEQAAAARFLESVGGYFCANFGYNNVLDIAREALEALGDAEAERRLMRNRGIKLRRPATVEMVQ